MLGTGINGSTTSVGPVAGKRPKVALQPGRSLMDWIRLGSSGKDIQGFGGNKMTVTMEELAKHDTEDDCWMLLRGNVYNVTAYMEYHPGGMPELMRGAGQDATKFFDEIHKWVNLESMLGKCLIGPIETPVPLKGAIKSSGITLDVAPPSQPTQTADKQAVPRYEWYQNNSSIFVSIYAKRKDITEDDIIVDCANGKLFDCKVLLVEQYFQIRIDLENEITSFKVTGPTNSNGKFDISLQKSISGLKWNSLGEKLDGNNKLHDDKDRELVYRHCCVDSIKQITSNTKLFSIRLPERVHYRVPIGHHILIEGDVQGMKIGRNYTVALGTLNDKDTENNNGPKPCSLKLMIKIYEDGALTPNLGALQVGDTISVSDSTGDFKLSRLTMAKSVIMIAAGTGLTPMIRLMHYVIHDRNAERKAMLLFANRHESDILWRDELDSTAESNKDRLKIKYILSRPPDNWNGLRGRIDKGILADVLSNVEKPAIEQDILLCICGSTEFTELIKGYLLEMEFTDAMIHCFLG